MIGKGQSSITKEEILKQINEFDLLAYYIDIDQIPCVINSPLREDNHPSFGVYTIDGEKLRYHDFGTGQSGGTFDLLLTLWGVDYIGALGKVEKDLPKFLNKKTKVTITKSKLLATNKRIYSRETDLQVKVREWKKHDLDYWEMAGISLPWLKFGDVHPISHIIVTKNGSKFTIPADKYAYVYTEFKDDKISLKIYQPLSTTHKWSNKHDGSVWDLWTKIPLTGEKLIITSSRKDALCIWENTGIPCVSLQAESYLPKPHVIQQLKDRFKEVFILYDNDSKSKINYGRLAGQEMALQFGLVQIEIPTDYCAKDSSDLAASYGREEVKRLIPHLIEEGNK